MKIRRAKLSESKWIYINVLKKPNRSAYDEELVKDLIKDKEDICLVAVEDRKIIGVLGARREGHKGYWLYFVHSTKKMMGLLFYY